METSNINTLTGSVDKRPKSGATATSAGNSDAFASAMGEAGGAEGAESKKADVIDRTDGSKDKEIDKKSDHAEEARADGGGKKVDGRVSDYVKSVSGKDPATLSLVEKQAFRMGEFSTAGKGNGPAGPAGGMAQMLAQQGIDVSGFSPQQIKGLMSRMDTKEIGKLLTQLKSDPTKIDDKTLKELKEKVDAAAQGAPQDAPQSFNLEGMLATGNSKEAGEAARSEQRREVLDQILAKIDVRNVANQTELNLRLNPEYLGEVRISLINDDDGKVRAKFQTTSKATREVLSDAKVEFMEQAKGKGVSINAMDVELVDELEA